ncbi:hypothetical protein HN011_000781 [Eciton burchellii]|nr:hypothetical protein HN011_000781 [Eciton burchellii]
MSSKWIIMHLHLELSISQSISRSEYRVRNRDDSENVKLLRLRSFGTTIFSISLIDYCMKKLAYCMMIVFWTSLYILKFILINYMCEKVCIKVSAIGNIVNRILCFTRDAETAKT